MAASATKGPKGQPRFPANEAPDMGVDEEILADYAAKVGNRRVGTTAERNAATGSDLWEGLIWGDTTDKLEYRRTAGAWARFGDIERVVNGRTGTPAAGTQFIHEYKFVQGLTNSGGLLAIPFAVAFPNGAGHIFFTANSGTGSTPVLNAGSLSKTGFTVAFPTAPTTNVDFSYHAIGW